MNNEICDFCHKETGNVTTNSVYLRLAESKEITHCVFKNIHVCRDCSDIFVDKFRDFLRSNK